jgi:hypothetical protein
MATSENILSKSGNFGTNVSQKCVVWLALDLFFLPSPENSPRNKKPWTQFCCITHYCGCKIALNKSYFYSFIHSPKEVGPQSDRCCCNKCVGSLLLSSSTHRIECSGLHPLTTILRRPGSVSSLHYPLQGQLQHMFVEQSINSDPGFHVENFNILQYSKRFSISFHKILFFEKLHSLPNWASRIPEMKIYSIFDKILFNFHFHLWY